MSTPSDPGTPSDGSAPEFAHRLPPKKRRRIFSVKRVLLFLLVMFLLGVGAVVAAFAMVSVPQPNDLASAQASIIYYAGGKAEIGRISEVNRESVPLSQIPVHVQHALLAAEDRSFYTNNGVSPSGIARALVVALKGGPTQGGSTITQQYVKNYFLTQDRTISRKAKEFIISIKIDQQESKSTILANYLNTIYYGRGAYGIQTAARAYFGHDASKLTVAEGALLASVIRGPSYYDPGLGATEKANATARMNYVLDGMVTQGWLTPQARARITFPKTISKVTKARSGPLGYIINEVNLELTHKLGLKQSDIDRGGLRIVTTINKKAQDSAVRAVNANMPSEGEAPDLHVGLTAIRPGDGAIAALYGGKDFSKRQINSATQDTMQGGSTFKVFGLLAALQKEISTKTQFDGYSPQYFPQFVGPGDPRGKVPNFGNEQFGRIDLRTALADSVNTVFAQLNIKLAAPGVKATGVRDAAILAGVPKTTAGLGTAMNNILGTASPHVIDMANAYATVAAQGVRATPYLITSVTSATIDYKVKKDLVPAFDKAVTADVTDAMTQVVTRGTGTGALALGRPAAGKTGTTDKALAVWFDGFTPQLSAAVAVYKGKGKLAGTVPTTYKNGSDLSSGFVPVNIWTAFMKGALQGAPVKDFPPRVGLGDSALPPPPPPPTTTSAPTSTTPTFTHTQPTPTTTQTQPTSTSTSTRPGPTRPVPTITLPPRSTGPPR